MWIKCSEHLNFWISAKDAEPLNHLTLMHFLRQFLGFIWVSVVPFCHAYSLSSSLPSKDTGPSLLSSLSLTSSSPSSAFYSEAKTVSGGSLLNGPLSYSQSSDIIKVRVWRHTRAPFAPGIKTHSHYLDNSLLFHKSKDGPVTPNKNRLTKNHKHTHVAILQLTVLLFLLFFNFWFCKHIVVFHKENLIS